MNNMNSLVSSTTRQGQVSGQGAINKVSASKHALATESTCIQSGIKPHVSAFSRLLADAATRAIERDLMMDRSGLAEIAKSTIDKLFGEGYQQNKVGYDAEVPNSDDHQRLALAQQATDFSNGKGNNPFKGMSRDQLALIAYDDSGRFTTNERRAACKEAYAQEEAWRRAVVAKLMDEYHRNGKISSDSYQEVLDHYKSLPAIEEAQLPGGYDLQFQNLIDQNCTESSPRPKELESFLDRLTKILGENRDG